MLTVMLLWIFERCTIPNLDAHLDAADVGDALFINTEWSMVEEIALQYTMVQRYDGVRIWWPNHVLCNGAVMNISRSGFRWESYKVGRPVGPVVWQRNCAACRLKFGAAGCQRTDMLLTESGHLTGQAGALQRLPLSWSSSMH